MKTFLRTYVARTGLWSAIGRRTEVRSALRTILLVLCCSAGAFALQTPPQTPAPVPQFRAGVDIFQLEVTVLDSQHQPVSGLHSSAFSVLENGKPQPIVDFQEIEFPEYDGPQPESKEETAPDVSSKAFADRRLISVVLDDWGWPQERDCVPKEPLRMETAKQTARLIVDSMGAADLASVTLTRDLLYAPDFTNNPWKLAGNISQFKLVCGLERVYLEQLAHQNGRGIGLIQTLEELVDRLSKLPQHIKTIVVVGYPPDVTIGGRSNSPAGDVSRLSQLFRSAQVAGISISGIDVLGLTVARRLGVDFFKVLAENTGGRAIVDTNDIAAGVPTIYRQHHSYYLIGYQQTGAKDGKFRKLEVHLDRPGLTIHTRSGYFAPGPPDMVKATPPPYDEAADRAISAMEEIGSTRRLYTYATAEPGLVHAAVEISSRELQAGQWATGGAVNVRVLRGTGGVIATATGRIEPGSRGALFDIPLEDADGKVLGLEAGPFHVSLQVVAGGTSVEGGQDATTAGLLIGEPLVYRLTSGPRAQPRAVAEFQFLRTERIRIEWPALQPVDPPQVRLLRRTGETINVAPTVTERDENGRKILSCELPLSSLGAGEYLIDIVVQRGERAERKVVAFRVVQ